MSLRTFYGGKKDCGVRPEVFRKGIRPDGCRIGVLEDMRDMAGQKIWFVRDEAGNEILLPAVEEIVVEIDLGQGLIRVDPPDGLVELYQNQNG